MVTDEGLAWADGMSPPSDPAFAIPNFQQVRYTGDTRRFFYQRSGFPKRKSSCLHSLMSSHGSVTFPPSFLRRLIQLHFFFQLADRWTNELADKDSAGIINVADGLMRVTLDACVSCFPAAEPQSRLRTIAVWDSARGLCVQCIQPYSLELITHSRF